MNYIGIAVFALTLALLAAAIIYVSSRFALFFPYMPKKTYARGFIVLFIAAFLCMSLFTTTANPFGKAAFIFAAIAVSLFLFLLISIALVDICGLIFKFPPQKRGFFSVGLALLLAVYAVWNAYSLKVKEVTIPIKGLTHEIRAVHLTDVHLGNWRGKEEADKIARKIQELNPDVIFNTGDMFDSKAHFGNGKDVLSSFRALNIPHYFVYGNHDSYVGVEEVIAQMKNANAAALLNEAVYFGKLQIVGLNNMLPDNNSFDMHTPAGSETIESALDKIEIDKTSPVIVLHHRPDGIKYIYESGADLLLAGHTHGGQIFPFMLASKLIFGYNGGLYQYETMGIHVSEGTGTIFAPIRLGTSSEMTLIKLIPSD
ncbi:MAG: metallophosphoesterase [Campylobacteraceae bacterium]|jgi:predicted MPP superfamily phosphohydrolase|nr:metallophosphoesterase [Campylobacteraceae bacterium]